MRFRSAVFCQIHKTSPHYPLYRQKTHKNMGKHATKLAAAPVARQTVKRKRKSNAVVSLVSQEVVEESMQQSARRQHAPKTQSTMNSYVKKWMLYCEQRKIDDKLVNDTTPMDIVTCFISSYGAQPELGSCSGMRNALVAHFTAINPIHSGEWTPGDRDGNFVGNPAKSSTVRNYLKGLETRQDGFRVVCWLIFLTFREPPTHSATNNVKNCTIMLPATHLEQIPTSAKPFSIIWHLLLRSWHG
jgi:hypothetical protein